MARQDSSVCPELKLGQAQRSSREEKISLCWGQVKIDLEILQPLARSSCQQTWHQPCFSFIVVQIQAEPQIWPLLICLLRQEADQAAGLLLALDGSDHLKSLGPFKFMPGMADLPYKHAVLRRQMAEDMPP